MSNQILTEKEIGEIYRAGWSTNLEFARALEKKVLEKISKREWVSLTDEDVKALPEWFPSHSTSAVLPLVRAVQAKLKEKNT